MKIKLFLAMGLITSINLEALEREDDQPDPWPPHMTGAQAIEDAHIAKIDDLTSRITEILREYAILEEAADAADNDRHKNLLTRMTEGNIRAKALLRYCDLLDQRIHELEAKFENK